ncbi:hypothetical protein Poly24_06600 [Rosistilla carotiformis]|uniref:Tetratricopeptide repeat protein n=1 Tax=Rosistilla carotiformis TaxID=2528017 RepID=A0A518JN39_9BACT|nr:hypothetical protein [Rosistilla carotiformis]QDV66970.1 hypothetical protein Poly24_06600 [Rosistilla carotiformis]
MRLTYVLILAFACGIACADDGKPAIVLEESPASVDEAMERLSGRTKELDGKLTEIQAAHLKATRDAEAKAIGWLKQIARFEVGKGQLTRATEAWTEVLKLDFSDKEAREFFTTIGRLDVVQAQIKRERDDSKKPLSRTMFVCESGRVFKKISDGKWEDTAPNHRGIHREVRTDATGVLLEQIDNSTFHWLTATRFYWNTPKNRHLWHIDEPGVWER